MCYIFNVDVCRWRPLEAALAAVGSQARTVLECIDDEGAAGRPKPIDIESLLANVIPSLLGLSGIYTVNWLSVSYLSLCEPRMPVLAGSGVRLCKSVCETTSRAAGRAIPQCCHPGDRSAHGGHSYQDFCCKSII